ncbi:MAG: histidine phosphatase family protein [Leptonema illini]|uniref:Histidine phosphatase family protein n=1 Tax=Leptonema illini TaxID=183 RepID=A0A833LY15_9LEPT|nr:MAG: histidine phosphatase family protein [Leptonema illini]
MTPVKRLFLLRHGPTGAGDRYIGATDLPLSDDGAADLADTAAFLRRQDIDAVYCSPMRRCRQTLDLLGLGCRTEIVDDLREVDFGRWEGLSFAGICERDQALVDQWAQGGADFTFPGGEAMPDFLARVGRVRRMLATATASRPLLVTHGGIIRHLLCLCLGIAPEKALLFSIRAGRCAILDLHPAGGVLAGLNLRD